MSLSTNFNVTLPTVSTPATLFDSAVDGGACPTFCVSNRSTSSEYAFVNVQGVHPANYWAPIAPGETADFRGGNPGSIGKATGYSAAGTAVVDTKIIAKF